MRLKAPFVAWLLMVLLTCLSVLAAHQAHAGASRAWMTALVACIAWGKGLLLIRHFLESHRAGAVFHRIVMGFATLAPLVLLVSGWHEFIAGG